MVVRVGERAERRQRAVLRLIEQRISSDIEEQEVVYVLKSRRPIVAVEVEGVVVHGLRRVESISAAAANARRETLREIGAEEILEERDGRNRADGRPVAAIVFKHPSRRVIVHAGLRVCQIVRRHHIA